MNGKRALVTGGFGLIGSHLVEELLRLGNEVRVLDDGSTGNYGNLSEIVQNENISIYRDSIINRDLVRSLMKNVDICFHLAASLGVKRILEEPLESYRTNIHGTENVLEEAASAQVKVFLASTSEIYGKNPLQPLSETSDRVVGSPENLRWIYSESKALDESIAHALHLQKGLKFVVGRYFNIVGARQIGNYGMVLPRFVKSALKGHPIKVYGDGSQSRVFCNVRDAVKATLLIANNSRCENDTFNIGGVEEVTIHRLAERVIKVLGSSSSIEFVEYKDAYPSGFEETMRRVPNLEKITSATGWKPEVSLDETIEEVADWMRNL